MSECQRNNCDEPAVKHFCVLHLKNPLLEPIMLTKTVSISPVKFLTAYNSQSDSSMNNAVGRAIQSMNPLNIKKSRSVKTKLKKSFDRSRDHNEDHLKVIVLEKTIDTDKSMKFAPTQDILVLQKEKDETGGNVENDSWSCSEDFLKIMQLEDQHQLILDGESNRLVFFIPR